MPSVRKFNVVTPITLRDGGTFWHQLGRAYENGRGTITIYFNSFPAGNNNRVCLFPEKEGEKKEPYTGMDWGPDGQYKPAEPPPDDAPPHTDDDLPFG